MLLDNYEAMLSSGQRIVVPNWSASTAVHNLIEASSVFGADTMYEISKLNTKAALAAIVNGKDAAKVTKTLKYFCCAAIMDGEKVLDSNFDQRFSGDNMFLAVEVFTHVVHAQFERFFALGLAKESSQ